MTTTYRVPYKPAGGLQLYWAPEMLYSATPGTAGSGTAGTPGTTAYREPCLSFDDGIQRATYEDQEYRGVAYDHFDSIETTHHAEPSIQMALRQDGFANFGLASMAGDIGNTGAVETFSTGVHTIKPGVSGHRTNTFALWFSNADAANLESYVYGVVDSIELAPNPDSIVQATMRMKTFFPSQVGDSIYPALPASPTVIDDDRAYGYNCVYHVKNSAGSDYAGAVINGTVTVTRGSDVFNSPSQGANPDPQSPYDFIQGPLAVAMSFSTYFTGQGTGSAWLDYKKYNTLGSSSAKHSMQFVDKAGNYTQINAWPAKWQPGAKISRQGNALMVSGTIGSYQDKASATQVSPITTVVSELIFKNSITTGMIA